MSIGAVSGKRGYNGSTLFARSTARTPAETASLRPGYAGRETVSVLDDMLVAQLDIPRIVRERGQPKSAEQGGASYGKAGFSHVRSCRSP